MTAKQHVSAGLCSVAVGLVTLAACGGDSGTADTSTTRSSTSTTEAAAPTVTMTIADHAQLSEAIPWEVDVATANGEAVTEVAFLIDGEQQWREKNSPFFFNDDDQVLAPWLLGAGPHELAVRVKTANGGTATITADVEVTTDVSQNETIAGTYHREVTAADQARVASYRTPDKGAFGEVPPTGQWTLEIRPNGEIIGIDPSGDDAIPFVEPFSLSGSSLRLYGPAIWRQPDPSTPSLFCEPEKASDYSWSLSGSSLTITEEEQVCADRDIVFVGTWTKD